MEGKYTKISALVGIVALSITIWQVYPKSKSNYSGQWKMISVIEEAQMKNYVGLKIEWVLNITQTGDQIHGSAEKISVNDVSLDFKYRTTLSVQGTVDANRFVWNYSEKGRLRETTGLFKGEFDNDKFSGIFSSTASNSKGKINGVKVH